MPLARGDGACQGEVLDGSVSDIQEESCASVAVVGNRGGDGMSVAVECAAERMGLPCNPNYQ